MTFTSFAGTHLPDRVWTLRAHPPLTPASRRVASTFSSSAWCFRAELEQLAVLARTSKRLQHIGQARRIELEAQPGWPHERFSRLAVVSSATTCALLQHGDATAQGFRLFEVMRGEHDGVALAIQAPDESPQTLAQLHVHAGGRLVQHDHRRLVHQRLRHQHAALHAAGKGAHIGIRLVGQTQVVPAAHQSRRRCCAYRNSRTGIAAFHAR